MEFYIFTDEHFGLKKVSKKVFYRLANYATSDNSKFIKDYRNDLFDNDNLNILKNTYFESNEYFTYYFWLADGCPMGFIINKYY